MDFLKNISHSGDTLPAAAGRDAPRFIHESQSYVTTTHINHTIHACTAAASRAAAKAMRDYSLIRATNHGLLLNAAHAPPVVPTPTLLLRTMRRIFSAGRGREFFGIRAQLRRSTLCSGGRGDGLHVPCFSAFSRRQRGVATHLCNQLSNTSDWHCGSL